MGSTFDGGKIGRKPSCSSQLMWRSYWTESFSCHCEHKIHSASGFTPLSRLTPGKHRCRVRVRISRMWTAFHPDTSKEYGLDSLLIDDEGCAMQARAPPGVMKRLQQQLVVGKIYALSDFTVSGRMKNFMVCRNELMLYMGAHTRVNEIGGDIIGYSIPSHSFEFVDFSNVPYRNGDKSLLTDIMGQIVYIGDIQRVQKLNPIRLVRFRTIEIRDLRGREQDVTLYGDLGCQFDVELVLDQGQEAPVIAVFAGICVEYYAGKGFIVRSTSASKCYLDLKIQEVQEFRASLCHPHTPIAHEPCKQENDVDPIQEILSTWRTIEQLKSLDPLKLQNTRFMCTATLKDIDCTNGCWYLGCFHCWQSISQDGTKFWCSKGCPKDPPPVLIYKLDAVVEDATGDMHFTIFGNQAQALIGVTAEELVEEIAGDDDKDAIHDEIVGLAGLPMEHTFQVAVKERNFVVKWVLKDEDVEQLRRIKYCTPQDEVKMVVKEETELKGLGTANDSEQLKVVVKEEPEN